MAAAGVLAALPTDSTALLSLAAASSVGLGAAATRITHAEVLTTRRDAAADRAERAQEHRVLTERAQARHRAREADLGDRVREARNTVAVLRVRLAEVEGRAAEDAERIALLEAELDAARTELLTSRDELAARRAAGGMPVWVAPHG